MKTTICKRCKTPDLYWMDLGGRWQLQDRNGQKHFCDIIQLVPCKYCDAKDLHWAEERQEDGTKKPVLTESYGLPHACDERLAFLAKDRQEKKEKWEAAKERIRAVKDGTCPLCNGSTIGRGLLTAACELCLGHGNFNSSSRRYILDALLVQIYPNMKKKKGYGAFYGRRRW